MDEKIRDRMIRQNIRKGIEDKKAYSMAQMLKKSKQRHDRSIKNIELEKERKVFYARKNRERED